MAYISSNRNRFYASVENTYGQAASIVASDRFPATRLQASQSFEIPKRLDKTGSRTYQGSVTPGRRHTDFSVSSYLSAWNGSGAPPYGPLFQAALGGLPCLMTGLTVNSVVDATQIVTQAAHNLFVGAGLSWGNEIRFVSAVPNAFTVTINAPFSIAPMGGDLLSPTMSYPMAAVLPSITLFDFWDSQVSIDRVITGCAVNTMDLIINGDYHDFQFAGSASEILTSPTFTSGTAGLSTYPVEPAITNFNAAGVPGHLGQAWLGNAQTQFFALTQARVNLRNNLQMRTQEFGFSSPVGVVPGDREVSISFSVLVQDDSQTIALYSAAKQRTTLSAMLQLGTQQGQIMGLFMPNVVPEIPDYDDTEPRLIWNFQNALAQGVDNDELFVAFA